MDLHRLVWAVPGLEPGIPCNFEFNLRFTPPREEPELSFPKQVRWTTTPHGRAETPPARRAPLNA